MKRLKYPLELAFLLALLSLNVCGVQPLSVMPDPLATWLPSELP